MEEVPESKHITAHTYDTGADDDEYGEVSLCRATRWDRVGGQQQQEGEEGLQPWVVMLQINIHD